MQKVMSVARDRLASAAGFWPAMEGVRCPVAGYAGWREWRAGNDDWKVAFPEGVPLMGLVKGEGCAGCAGGAKACADDTFLPDSRAKPRSSLAFF